jgi:hypothetical protein
VIPLAWLLPAIAGIMAVEIVVIGLQAPARRARFLPTVLAGFFIVLAWNAYANGYAALLILAALSAALLAHAIDIWRRW